MRIPRIPAVALLVVLALSPLTALAQGAEIRLLEPMPDGVILGNSLTVIFEVSGVQLIPSPVRPDEFGKRPDANRPDQGHLNLTLDLNPVVAQATTDPYIFMDVPPGQHLLTLEVVNNDGSSRTPPLILQRRIEVRPDTASTAPGVIRSLPDTGGADPREQLLLMLAAATLIVLGMCLRRSAQANTAAKWS